MNAVSVNNVAKSVKDENLFSNVTFGLDVGEHLGIIGKNGAGKSTFLKLLAGILVPDEGEIVSNRSLRIGYLAQDVTYTEDCTLEDYLRQSDDTHVQLLNRYYSGEHNLMEKIESLGLWDLEDRYRRYLSELGVTEPMSKKMSLLSGGTQKKAAIARILAIEPNILLLDEPTNHLDIPSIEWLEEHLKTSSANTTSQGAFTVVLVTHDRYFLDSICNRIMELDRNRAYFYEGGYTSFLSRREERITALAKEQDRLANILRRELEWLRRGPKARTGKDSGRKQRIEQMLGQQTREEDSVRAFGSMTRRMGKKILELRNVSIGRDGTLIRNLDLEFIKGQRIGIIGANGSGKSTLLDVLTGNLPPLEGEVDTGVNTAFGYYDQQSAKLPLDKTPVEYFSDFAQNIVVSEDYTVTPARFLELFGFPSSFHRLPIGILSGGERRRLYLLSCLMTNPNFLVLDEPTNDLDIDTLRRLEQYILDFQGCVVAVSHDRAFLDRICTELIVMPEDGCLEARRYEGTYSDWKQDMDEEKKSKAEQEALKALNLARAQKAQQASNAAGASNAQSGRTQKKGLSYKQQKEFEQIENDIQTLEEEKQSLEDFFSSGKPDTTGEKTKRYSNLNCELEEKYARWEELASLA